MVQPHDEERLQTAFPSLRAGWDSQDILGHQHCLGSRLAPAGRTRYHLWQTTTHLGSFQLQHRVAEDHPNDLTTLRHVL